MITKYGFEIADEVIKQDKKRLVNQLWKLIPMKEKEEDWNKQLVSVIIEITGLNKIFAEKVSFLILLSKLEGLERAEKFEDYRKTVFESIGLLDGLINE